MKRILFLILMAVCLPALALAAGNRDEWNLTCLHTVDGGCTVYELIVKEVEDGTYATATDLTYVFYPIGSIGAGEMVKPTGEVINGKHEVAYWNGGRQYGYVDAGMYSSDSFSVKGSNGKTYRLPNWVRGNSILLELSISLRYSASDIEYVLAGMNGATEDTDDGTGSSSGKKVYRPSATVSLKGEGDALTPVRVKTLGLVNSIIVLNGEEQTVPTASLHWETNAKDSKKMAVVKAHRVGESTMHSKKNGKGDVLKKCKTNRVVLVLETGGKYSRILYDGVAGYVLTSTLTFYPVGGVKGDDPAPQKGWISYRGKITGTRATVNIRQSDKNGSRILKEFRAGTEIIIYGQGKKWTEVEVDGYRGYILNEYVTIDAQTETAQE